MPFMPETLRKWPVLPNNYDYDDQWVYRLARKRAQARLSKWMGRLRAQCKYPRPSIDSIPTNDSLAIDRLLRQGTNDFLRLSASYRGYYWPHFIAILTEMRPTSVMDIAIAHALSRQRAGENGITARFLSLVAADRCLRCDRLIEPYLRATRGMIIFRENLMEVGRAVAGFSVKEAQRFSRQLICWPDESSFALARYSFVRGAHDRGVAQNRAVEIFDLCAMAAKDGVTPRAHSLEYANLNYRLAYMKAHFPREAA
jgi:DNA polymerase-3 subunit alpha